MGKRRVTTVYKLSFDETMGEELAGLEIATRGATMDQIMDIAHLGGVDFTNLMESGIEQLRGILHSFPDRIVDWNYEDEKGRPIPATKENFLDEDYTFTQPVLMAWMNLIRSDPKNAAALDAAKPPPPAEETPDDLSDLPMTISDGRLYKESEL